MSAAPIPSASSVGYSVEEYLRQERDAIDKHEYRDGHVVAMAGGSPDHSLIIANVIGETRNRLDGKPRRVYDSNLRVRAAGTSLYTYPDVSIICGQVELDPDDSLGQTVLNPTAVMEVLSPSTEAYDRGEKFERYRRIPSLREYVLITQSAPRIEMFFRREDGSWLFHAYTGLDAVTRLRCVEIDLPLAEVYEGITFAA